MMRMVSFAAMVLALALGVAACAPAAWLQYDYAASWQWRDSKSAWQDDIELDEQAFSFLGLPLVGAGSAMRDVTVVVFDAWDDAHGVLVASIVEKAIPGVRVVQYDYAVAIADCPQSDMFTYVVCAQARFADIFERIVSDVPGFVVVNMSFKMFYMRGHRVELVLAARGCESDSVVAYDASLSRIARVVTGSPERFVWVAAAGNESSKARVGFPACLSRVWSVSALERQAAYSPESLVVAGYSNWAAGDHSVAVPIGGRMFYFLGWAEGTSFAAPAFSGLMATWIGLCSALPPVVDARYWAGVPGGLVGAQAPVPTVLDVRC